MPSQLLPPLRCHRAVHRRHCRPSLSPSLRPSPPSPLHRRCLAILALFLAALIPRLPVGCCTDASTSRHLPSLVCCRHPRRHLLALFLVCRLVVTSTPPPLIFSLLLSTAVLLATASSSSFSAATPVIVVVDDDKDKEDDGVILSGVSAVVGIVPVIFVVDNDNNNEDNGIILLILRMALLEPQKTRTLQFSLNSPTFPPLAWRTRRPRPKNVMRCGPKCNIFVASLRNTILPHWLIGQLFKYWLAFGWLNVSRPLT